MSTNVDNINNFTATGKAQANNKNKNSLLSNIDEFLLLLTTQLKYQDPSQAQDPSVFTQQLVQLSSLEQQINSNKKLEEMNAAYAQSQVYNASNFVDKQIDTTGNKTYFDGVNPTSFVYSLDRAATEVTVTIKDATGATVFEGSGPKTAGRNEVIWSGTKMDGTTKATEGEYSITVTAVDSGQKSVTATTMTSGRVSSVDLQDGKMVLMIGTIKVPVEKVLSIRAPFVFG